MTRVERVLQRYREHEDFEHARDQLHALGPAAMRHVLAAALDPAWHDTLPLLVMALSDVLYPPAAPAFRTWMRDPDIDGIAMPAASGLDRIAKSRFGIDEFWGGDRSNLAESFERLASWWDEGKIVVVDEQVWLAEREAKRAAQQQDLPPPSPALSPAQNAALRPALIDLVQVFRELDPRVQHVVEHAAVSRAQWVWQEFAPDDSRITDALAVVERFLAGDASEAELVEAHAQAIECTREATAVAAWNPQHKGWMRPDARAAANLAQAVAYLCSSEPRNRLQGLHFSRDAVEWSGAGVASVEAEMAWQQAQVEAAGG